MKFEYDISQLFEQNLRAYLTAARESNPTVYRVTAFMLFSDLNASRAAAWVDFYKRNPLQRRPATPDYGITATTFNKTIGDLKKVGIIGTCKGGEEVFLSNAAWELHLATQVVRA